MSDRTAGGAPGPDLEVPDVGRRQGQQRHRIGDLVVHADEGVRCRRTDADVVAAEVDARQFVDPRDVDEVVEVGQPHGEQRHQALTAGQDRTKQACSMPGRVTSSTNVP